MAAGPQATSTWTTGQGAALPTAVDFNGFSAMMKEVYGEASSLVPQEATMYRIFEERLGAEMADGRVFVEPLHIGRNLAAGPRPPTGTALPDPQAQELNRFEIPVRFYHGAGSISFELMARTLRANGSVANALDVEVNGALGDLRKELNVDLYGSPHGVLAVVESDGGGGVINVRPAVATDDFDFGGGGADPNAWESYLALQGTRFCPTGRPLHIASLDPATGVLTYRVDAGADDLFTVSSRTDFNTLTVDSAPAGLSAGDVLIRYRSHGTTTTVDTAVHALNGLEYLIDDTTFVPDYLDDLQGHDRSANTDYQAVVVNKDGEALEEEDIFSIVHRCQEESGESPDFLLTGRVGEQVVYNFYRENGRFAPRTFPGGYQANALSVSVGGVDLAVFVDKDCPYRTIYAINAQRLKRYVLYEAHLAEQGGSILERAAAGDDTWVFRLRWAGNMGITVPKSCGKISNVSGLAAAADGGMLQTFGSTAAVTY